jgi:hypothetical protein
MKRRTATGSDGRCRGPIVDAAFEGESPYQIVHAIQASQDGPLAATGGPAATESFVRVHRTVIGRYPSTRLAREHLVFDRMLTGLLG